MEDEDYYLVIGALLCSLPVLLWCYRRYVVRAVMCTVEAKLTNKVVLITGATSGIGYETARELARRGAKLLLACRDLNRGEEVQADILSEVPGANIELYEVDLTSLQSVRALAAEVKSKERYLDILVNNAAIGGPDHYTETSDAIEVTFCVNYIAPFLLTHQLQDLLERGMTSRVINVAAHTHVFGSIHVNDLMLSGHRAYSPFAAYAQSKLALIIFTRRMAQLYTGSGVNYYAVHPGVTNTPLRHGNSALKKYVLQLVTKTPWEGAQTIVWCATNPELEGETGKYYSNCAESTPIVPAFNDSTSSFLWDESLRLACIDSLEELD